MSGVKALVQRLEGNTGETPQPSPRLPSPQLVPTPWGPLSPLGGGSASPSISSNPASQKQLDGGGGLSEHHVDRWCVVIDVVAGRNLPITGKTDTYCCLSLIGGTSQIEVQKHLIVDHNVSKLYEDEHFSKNSIQGGYKILYINPQKKTRNFKQSLAPEWKESFECTDSRTNIAACDQKSPENLLRSAASTSRLAGQDVLLLCTLHNSDSVGSDKYVGWVSIPLQQNTSTDDWYCLKTREGNDQLGHSGLPSAIHLRAKYVYRKGPVLKPAGAKPRKTSLGSVPPTPVESDAKHRAQPEKAVFEMPALTPQQQSGRAQNDKDSARRNSRSSLADSILSGGSDFMSPIAEKDFKMGTYQEPLSVSQLSRSFLSPDQPPTAPTPSPDVSATQSELRNKDSLPEGLSASKVSEANGHASLVESSEANGQDANGEHRESHGTSLSKRSGPAGVVDMDRVFEEIEAAHRLSLEAEEAAGAGDSSSMRLDLNPTPLGRLLANGASVAVEGTVVKHAVEALGSSERAEGGRGAGGSAGWWCRW